MGVPDRCRCRRNAPSAPLQCRRNAPSALTRLGLGLGRALELTGLAGGVVLAEVAAGQMVGCPPMIQPMRVRSRFQSGPSPSPPPPPSPSPFTFTFHPGAEQLAADMAEALRVSQVHTYSTCMHVRMHAWTRASAPARACACLEVPVLWSRPCVPRSPTWPMRRIGSYRRLSTHPWAGEQKTRQVSRRLGSERRRLYAINSHLR